MGRKPESEDEKEVFKTMMEFKFEKLVIWQKATEYGEGIYRLSQKKELVVQNII